VLVAGLLVTAGIVFLVTRFPDALDDRDAKIKLVHATLLLSVFLLPSLFYRQIKARQALKSAAIWFSIGVILFIGYAYRDEMKGVAQRLAGELMPGAVQITGNSNTIRMGRDGHFSVEAQIDGVTINFLVDTGASDVVLSPKDADKLGFSVDQLTYSKTYRTANGEVQGAPVQLGQITIGSIQMNGVRASVNSAAMNRSLLGMSFLDRLSGFQINGNNLTLTQ